MAVNEIKCCVQQWVIVLLFTKYNLFAIMQEYMKIFFSKMVHRGSAKRVKLFCLMLEDLTKNTQCRLGLLSTGTLKVFCYFQITHNLEIIFISILAWYKFPLLFTYGYMIVRMSPKKNNFINAIIILFKLSLI